MRKLIEHSVLLVFLIPLFFINIKSSHDWGDDFAQYIHQAKNIVEGVSQNNTGYVFNKDITFMGPQAYPTGFPLLLAPIIKHYGLNFKALNYEITLFLVLICMAGFIFLRSYFSFYTSFFVTLILAYNPYFINFKSEVGSDLPFTFFLLLSIYLIHKRQTLFISIVLGLIMAYSLHIRSVGILIIVVFVLQKLLLGITQKRLRIQFDKFTWSTLVSFLILYLSLKYALPCNTNYPSFFEFNGLFDRANEHVSYHFLALSYFFNIYEPKTQYFIGVIASSGIITFSILGYLYEWKKHKYNFINLFVLAYITTIAIFKFGDQGFRFLVPILFFILYYSIIALKYVLKPLIVNWTLSSVVFGLIILLSYKPAIEKILENENKKIEGPCTDASYQLFNYIKTLNLHNEVIIFEKPRALALFTNCKSIAITNDLKPEDVNLQMNKYHATYILLHKQLYNKALTDYANSNILGCELIFSNSDYKFYKLTLYH